MCHHDMCPAWVIRVFVINNLEWDTVKYGYVSICRFPLRSGIKSVVGLSEPRTSHVDVTWLAAALVARTNGVADVAADDTMAGGVGRLNRG